jgi:hypothetical protein
VHAAVARKVKVAFVVVFSHSAALYLWVCFFTNGTKEV